MDEKETSFQYRYSAKEQAEVEQIRNKYLPREESKLEQLRKLDHSASQKAMIWAITLGVIGVLILGTGMSLCMTKLSGFLGGTAMLVGIPVGIVGIVLVALAYPVYNRILQKERERIAPEILRLSEDLLQ